MPDFNLFTSTNLAWTHAKIEKDTNCFPPAKKEIQWKSRPHTPNASSIIAVQFLCKVKIPRIV